LRWSRPRRRRVEVVEIFEAQKEVFEIGGAVSEVGEIDDMARRRRGRMRRRMRCKAGTAASGREEGGRFGRRSMAAWQACTVRGWHIRRRRRVGVQLPHYVFTCSR
jgi:hypothetical protein